MVSLSRRNSERCSEIEKMKNKREDRFEAIVDQFVKNDLIAQEEYSYYLYGVKHLEVLIMTTGGVLLSGILLKEILFARRLFFISSANSKLFIVFLQSHNSLEIPVN